MARGLGHSSSSDLKTPTVDGVKENYFSKTIHCTTVYALSHPQLRSHYVYILKEQHGLSRYEGECLRDLDRNACLGQDEDQQNGACVYFALLSQLSSAREWMSFL
jgi:hypothetical protein